MSYLPASDTDPLSSEYHKAHKQLMLWSGILLVWDFVGFDLEIAKMTPGNIGTLLSAVKNPRAIPAVLLILVLYFLFKVAIEWTQCSALRRGRIVSRLDFLASSIISLLAIVFLMVG